MQAEIEFEFEGNGRKLTREMGEMMMHRFDKVGGEISWSEEENEGVMTIKSWESIESSYVWDIARKIERDFDGVEAEIKSIER